MPKSHNFYGISSDTQAKIYDRKNLLMSIDIFFERSVKVEIQNIDVKVLLSNLKVHLVYLGSGLRITDEGVLN